MDITKEGVLQRFKDYGIISGPYRFYGSTYLYVKEVHSFKGAFCDTTFDWYIRGVFSDKYIAFKVQDTVSLKCYRDLRKQMLRQIVSMEDIYERD